MKGLVPACLLEEFRARVNGTGSWGEAVEFFTTSPQEWVQGGIFAKLFSYYQKNNIFGGVNPEEAGFQDGFLDKVFCVRLDVFYNAALRLLPALVGVGSSLRYDYECPPCAGFPELYDSEECIKDETTLLAKLIAQAAGVLVWCAGTEHPHGAV